LKKIKVNTEQHNVKVKHIDKTSIKRKFIHTKDTEMQEKNKIPKCNNAVENVAIPHGFILDSENYSCAYDALFTILLSIWTENCSQWKKKIQRY
jgi:hypothetical protein